MLILFIFVIIIVMLNMLIALMGDSYEDMMENKDEIQLKYKAETILEHELTMSEEQLQKR